MLRALSIALAVSVLCLGVAAAKPGPLEKPAPSPVPSKKTPTLDPVWAKQLIPQVRGQPGGPQAVPIEVPPNFAAIKRMTLQERASALQVPAPEQVQGPLRFSARQNYRDERHYLELYSRAGRVNVRTSANYVYLWGPDASFADPYDRPSAEIHFVAEAGRRYLLECAVDVAGSTPGTISAIGPAATYAVSTADKATLLLRHDGGAAAADVMVSLVGDRPWYLDGCELSWTGP